MQRRQFLSALTLTSLAAAPPAPRPHILWITCEDMGPHLGCYGDRYAVSPHLDALARESLRYLTCWSNAPVCAPARTTIISGQYPPSLGAEHMRSMTRLGQGQKMFPQLLREAGYFTTNNVKTDYNVELTGDVWNESSNQAHWRRRAAGQPFFSVFNFTITHESQIRTRPHQLRHDPREAHVPAYQPDTPEVRHDWAQYYDNITTMDAQAGHVLAELAADGLAEETIVFFYADHGSGMPRSKRWPYDSGLHVPLLVRIPEKWRHLAPADYRAGGTTPRPVGFVDLAPTALALAGVPIPAYHQGTAFLGRSIPAAPRYLYGFRGRMDERYDLVRSVTDGRYVYLRQYMPNRIYGQHLAYMFETPTTQVWRRLFDEGKLTPLQRKFWETKPPEELYDLKSDPEETVNLAGRPEHAATLARLRTAQEQWCARIRDIGFLPENEIHERAGAGAPVDMGRRLTSLPRIQAMAGRAASLDPAQDAALAQGLKDPDSAVRYWAAQGFAMRRRLDPLRAALRDPAPAVRIVAAEAVGLYGTAEELPAVLDLLIDLAHVDRHGPYLSLAAMNALDSLGPRAKSREKDILALPANAPGVTQRMSSYPARMLDELKTAFNRE